MAKKKGELQNEVSQNTEISNQNEGNPPPQQLPQGEILGGEKAGEVKGNSFYPSFIKGGKVTIDASEFTKVMFSLCMGNPNAVMRRGGIEILARMFGVGYSDCEKFWESLRDYYYSRQ